MKKPEFTEEELRALRTAVEHYQAYLVSQQRSEGIYAQLLEKLPEGE